MPLDTRELHRRVNKLRKSLKTFSKNPTADSVHDLRTRTRRVESILRGLQLDRSGKERKLLDELKEIRKAAGKVRDIDVLTLYVVGLGLEDDPNCVIRLVHHLGMERHRQAAKLHSVVRSEGPESRTRLKSTRRKLDFAVEVPDAKKSSPREDGATENAPLQAMSAALRLTQELAAVGRLGRDNLHPYRIQVKRLRYLLEMAQSDRAPQHAVLDALKKVQDDIGEWHDWVKLSSMAKKVLRREANCQMLKKIRDTTEQKFAAALRATEQVRRKYLQAGQFSKSARSGAKRKESRLSGPVLVAASEIAA